MSASLVGSEMCIRDSPLPLPVMERSSLVAHSCIGAIACPTRMRAHASTQCNSHEQRTCPMP
eukprot:13222025-Alexandrium_andersonii.AAC.1